MREMSMRNEEMTKKCEEANLWRKYSEWVV